MFVNDNIAIDDPVGVPVETGVELPTPNERANWVYYDCALGCVLDSGIVVHRRLPQHDYEPDTLASCYADEAGIDTLTGLGVNLKSNDKFQDVVQRMAHSRYWFKLWGQAMRVGEQVPIPGLKEVGGVKAYPHDSNPQWAYNKVVGNYSGQVLWYAQWSLWYTLAEPPKKNQNPPANLAQHIGVAKSAPVGMQAPWTQPQAIDLQAGVIERI
jgi:hypothetical protein